MSLLNELNDAELVVADEDLGLMFVWYGGAGFQVLDEQGNVRDYFTVSKGFDGKLTVRGARRVIDRYRAEMLMDEES